VDQEKLLSDKLRMEKKIMASEEFRTEKALTDFVVEYAKKVKTAEEVQALAAVSEALVSLFRLYLV